MILKMRGTGQNVILERSERKKFLVPPHLEKWGYNFFHVEGTSNQITISIEYTEICHVHKAILDELDIKKLMQEFVLRKDNSRSLFGKYFNLMLIIRNVLL